MTALLSSAGETPNEIGSAIESMLSSLLPTNIPSVTGMTLGTISNEGDRFGAGPTEMLTNVIMDTISGQAATGDVPFSDQMRQDFSTIVSDMAFVDTSVVSTDESLNDMVFEFPVAATPWDDGSDKSINVYDPLFAYRSDRKASSPGFHTVATPVIINQIQARLVQTERDAALFGIGGSTRGRRAIVAQVGLPGSHQLHVDKRIRVIEARVPHDRVRPTTEQQIVDSSRLEALRYYGGLTPEELYAKLNYLGPVVQIWDSSGHSGSEAATTASYESRTLISERVFNYAMPLCRAKIQNIFGEALKRGDNLYFSISRYSREALLQIGAASGMMLGKRTYGAGEEVPVSSYVGQMQYASSVDEYTQVRGWSSRDGREYLGDTSPLDSLKPDAADRYYVERVATAASQYREFRYNETTDELVEVPLAAQEGVQEAINNLPDIVIENYLAHGIVIPVGTVKQLLNPVTTKRNILNAHYDARSLALQPHVEIYVNA